MKHSAFFLLIITSIMLGGCKDKTSLKQMANVPVYMDYASFRSSVKFEAPRSISKKGNISIKDDYLFIIEPQKGIHFIHNSNPAAPQKVGFLSILGCTNMSIKDHYLYANSFIDLVVIDITSISHPVVVNRVEDVFPQALPPLENNIQVFPIDKNVGVVIGWETRKVKEPVHPQQQLWENCPTCGTGNNTVSVMNATSIAGSITQFTIANDYLYAMDNNRLIPMNLSNPAKPAPANAVSMSLQVETLFPSDNYLFLGTTSGMCIMSVENPDNPVQVSIVTHVEACDPVVVQGDYAYVTIRTGTFCMGMINELQVIDISTMSAPVVVSTFGMTNPHGLGIDGDRLFICDGSAGLKLFDASNPVQSGGHLIQQFSSIQATDIIPHGNTAIAIGDNGLYQYDYSNPNSMKLLSTILFQ